MRRLLLILLILKRERLSTRCDASQQADVEGQYEIEYMEAMRSTRVVVRIPD